MEFVDRQSRYPGLYKITAKDGSSYYVTIERADEAIKEGTPLNAATFNALNRELKAYSDACNLLDNSNFVHPVNQRGGDAYGYDVDYNIDRWKAARLWVTVDSEYGYLKLKCADDVTERNGFYQYFAKEKTPSPGTTITVAYKDLFGSVFVGTAEMPETGSVAIGATTDIGFRVYSAAEGARVSLMIPTGKEVYLRWMAVYEGEYTAKNLPTYRPKDFSAELMECMRYYQVRSTGDVNHLDLRPAMRARPTVTKLEDGGYAYSADL